MKTLVITSPTHLWTILKSKEELYESERILDTFMSITERYIKGCNCGGSNKEELSISLYNQISNNIEIIEKLKETFNYNEIIFNN